MRQFIDSHKIAGTPLIAGVLTDVDIISVSDGAIAPIDIIELRVDMFETVVTEQIVGIFKTAKQRFGKPIIATVRDVREGGQREFNDRAGLYRSLMPLSDALDVEIQSEEVLSAVRGMLRDYASLLIGSYHNFDLTPDDEVLDGIVSKGKGLGADIVKIAAMARDREDLVRLLLFTRRSRDEGVITMSMGDAGLPSRVVAPLFGSLITYGYINRPSAPGQLSVAELFDIFRRLKIR